MSNRLIRNQSVFACLLCIGLQTTVQAENPEHELDAHDIAIIQNSVFAQSHPDLRYRLSAIGNIDEGRTVEAWRDLQHAARFGDKASQAMIAEALWLGSLGQGKDRALAYAWMDLAAERGHSMLVAKREIYWQGLSAAERERALSQGEQVYAEFGDAVALPRLSQRLDNGRRQQTGSRLGSKTGAHVYLADSSKIELNILHRLSNSRVRPLPMQGGKRVDLWNDKFWKLNSYLEWKAVELDSALSGRSGGVVKVMPLRTQPGRL